MAVLGIVAGYLIILAGFLYLALMPLAVADLLIERRWRDLAVAGSSIGGFLLAGVLSWFVLARGWTLSFATTLHASVDAATYGHPVEHYAESLLLGVLFFSLVGAVSAWIVTRRAI